MKRRTCQKAGYLKDLKNNRNYKQKIRIIKLIKTKAYKANIKRLRYLIYPLDYITLAKRYNSRSNIISRFNIIITKLLFPY